MTPETFLAHFRLVKRTKRNSWTADCPAHASASHASLSIDFDGEKMLVHCFGKCAIHDVLTAAGLTAADLFLGAKSGDSGPTITAYKYEDASGQLLYESVRSDYGWKPKTFFQRRPDGRGGWINKLAGVRRVLYRLPHLAEQRRIYLVEGEKCADAIAALGLAATTTVAGASSWLPEYGDQLASLAPDEIVALPDNDEPGEGYIAAAVASCLALGLRIRVLRLPYLEPKGDVADWLAGGGTGPALEALAAEAPFAATAAVATATTVHWSTVIDELVDGLSRPGPRGLYTPYNELNGYLSGGVQPGELVYLGAFPGVGKTALLLEFARGVAGQGGSALIFSREMVNLALTRRLLAQGARVPAMGLKDGFMRDDDRAVLAAALPKLKGLPIWLNQVASTIDAIAADVAAFAGAPPLAAVFVDYLQLVRGATRPGREQSRRLEVEAASQGLKAIALRHRIPVFCASSLSRGPQPEPGQERGKPSINLLRESGELEHDADIILLLHRGFEKVETECKIAKNRDGRVGVVKLLFREQFVAFDQPPREERA